MDTQQKREMAKLILEECQVRLDGIDMPCVLLSWTDDGETPDFVMVSDAPTEEIAFAVLRTVVKGVDGGQAVITKDDRTPKH